MIVTFLAFVLTLPLQANQVQDFVVNILINFRPKTGVKTLVFSCDDSLFWLLRYLAVELTLIPAKDLRFTSLV